MSAETETKKDRLVGYHLLMRGSLRDRMDVLAAATGKKVSELIIAAIEQTYFSGAPAVIEPPAKGE